MRLKGLKSTFIAIIASVYIVIGILTLFAFEMVSVRILEHLGTKFAIRQALLEKARVLSVTQKELAISIKLADSPMLKRWTLNEEDPVLKGLALDELDSYRRSFGGKSYFFVIAKSLHYYFNDTTGRYSGNELRYTLSPDNASDDWYFKTMREVDFYQLNLNVDAHLYVTKVWFNVIIKDSTGRKIGLGGTGIDISDFINTTVNSTDKGVSTILISSDGAIEGHKNRAYVEHNSRVTEANKKITVYEQIGNEDDKRKLKDALSRLASAEREVETLTIFIEGKQQLAAVAYLKDIGWYNLVLVDVAQVISMRDFLPILVIIVVSLFAIILIIGFLLNRIVLNRLAHLSRSSQEIMQGNYNIVVPVTRLDEIGMLTGSFNKMAQTVKDYTENLEQKVADRTEELNVSNVKLSESNQLIMDSIRYAQMIQDSMLPRDEVILKYVREWFAIYKPRDIVGGDFYYFHESNGAFFVALIDCTGHGVPGALMTMTCNAVLKHVIEDRQHDDPAAVLKELNKRMRETLQHDAHDSMMDNGFDIGLCYCMPALRKIVFAGARISLFHASHGDVQEIKGERQPIGYSSSDPAFDYLSHHIFIANADSFYMTTDGLLDQSGGERGISHGKKRFIDLILTIHPARLAEQDALLKQALTEYQGTYSQRDDITVIGFRI